MNLQDLKNVYHAFSNETRLAIIQVLRSAPLTVTEICERLDFEQSRVSHGLKFLESQCFIVSSRDGKWKTYSINTDTVLPILIMAEEHVKRHSKTLQKNQPTKKVAERPYSEYQILNRYHSCHCIRCIEVLTLFLDRKDLSKYKTDHVCNCAACFSNTEELVKLGHIKKLRKDHSCKCDTCDDIQKMLVV